MSTARRGQAVPMADMRLVGRLLRSGCTLIVDEINTYDSTMEVACRALQWWCQEFVQVNAYLTTGDAAGFQLHWDDHDVLIVQLAGEKTWEVRSLSRKAPMYRDSTPTFDPSDEIVWAGVIRAGDVMHIPRGYWHRATREGQGDGFSLHATFGMTKRTGVHWLSWLADHSRQSELFRLDLDRWGSVEKRNVQQLALTEAAVRLVANHMAADFLNDRREQQPSMRHVATHGMFGVPSEVVCMTEFPPIVERGETLVTVRAAGKKISFVERAWPALQCFLSGRPTSIEKVAAATGVDAAALAEVLLAEGICAEVTPELASGYAGLLTSEDG